MKHHGFLNKIVEYDKNVLLVEIEGLVWYTIYHRLPAVKGVC